MQQTSERFKEIWNSGNYESEIKVIVNGVEYRENQLMDVSIKRELFGGNNVTIGSACIASCSLTLISDTMTGRDLSDTIPRGARIEIWECIKGNLQSQTVSSEWLCQGVFFIDSRDYTSWTGRLQLNGIDRMAFADADYPGDSDQWPKLDMAVVQQIAGYMGVEIDSGTVLGNNYRIPIPASYTMREVLGYIAAMYAGNWIITKEGKLLLLKLNGLPVETNYLVTNYGSPITFGGVRILVS